ncbi:MAG: hypothetical protein WD226_03310 [Planctomycetota bacterium]
MKILSDFDGVWTDPRKEADAILTYLIEAAARAARVPLDEARADFAGFLELVNATPSRFGWAPDGWITGYVDEDPLLLSSGLGMLLEQIGSSKGQGDSPRAARYRDGILQHHESLASFTDSCFREATTKFLATEPNQLSKSARRLLAGWLEVGAEVVVVSNSGANKLVRWFQEHDIDAREVAGGELRVRGHAEKYRIGSEAGALEFSGRRIYVDRPRYRAALEEEQADVVIGDVFSLDLALPYVLRRDELPGAPKTLILKRHKHTPPWVLALGGEGPIDHMVDSLDQVPALLA